MKIKNAEVFNSLGSFENKDININGEFFGLSNDNTEFDASNCYAIPGLVDIHFHGCVGADFCDASIESLEKIAVYQLNNGITSICPASMTLSEEMLSNIFKVAASYKNEKGAELLGINMEGPYLSLEKKGAQNPKYLIAPDVEMFKRLQKDANGLIKICDLAPENKEAMDFISQMKDDVVISLAHTTAGYDSSKEAFDRGARQLTHMFNAMNGLNHREPGPIAAACENEEVRVELIADGIHIHPSMIRIAFKLFGDDRIMLISDSMEATGMPDGEYALGGQKVIKQGRTAKLESGTIAGSASNLYECLKRCVLEMGIPLASAVKCASVNPAKQIGIFDKYGSIDEGKYANLVLLDKDTLDIKAIFFKGKKIR